MKTGISAINHKVIPRLDCLGGRLICTSGEKEVTIRTVDRVLRVKRGGRAKDERKVKKTSKETDGQ